MPIFCLYFIKCVSHKYVIYIIGNVLYRTSDVCIKIHAELAEESKVKNSVRDARTPQPGEKVFNTMRYRSGETVKDLDTFTAVSVIKSSKYCLSRENNI